MKKIIIGLIALVTVCLMAGCTNTDTTVTVDNVEEVVIETKETTTTYVSEEYMSEFEWNSQTNEWNEN